MCTQKDTNNNNNTVLSSRFHGVQPVLKVSRIIQSRETCFDVATDCNATTSVITRVHVVCTRSSYSEHSLIPISRLISRIYNNKRTIFARLRKIANLSEILDFKNRERISDCDCFSGIRCQVFAPLPCVLS